MAFFDLKNQNKWEFVSLYLSLKKIEFDTSLLFFNFIFSMMEINLEVVMF